MLGQLGRGASSEGAGLPRAHGSGASGGGVAHDRMNDGDVRDDRTALDESCLEVDIAVLSDEVEPQRELLGYYSESQDKRGFFF